MPQDLSHSKAPQEQSLLAEDHPELMIEEDETSYVTLEQPVPFHYVLLTEKHLEEKSQPATLVGLSQRRGVIEAAGPLARYSNIMLQFEDKIGGEDIEELYAKVIRPLDRSSKQYLIHFTSIPPGAKAWLSRLAGIPDTGSAKM